MCKRRFPFGKHWAGMAVLIFVGCAIFPAKSRAQLWGDPKELKAAAKQHQANRERITTWQGKAKVEERLLAGKPLPSEVAFVYDAESGNYRWNWTIKDVPEGSWKKYSAGELLNGMVKDDKYYEYRSHFRHDAKGNDLPGGHMAITSVSQQSRHQNLVGYFDPMWHFKKPSGLKLDERLLFVAENAKDPKNEWETFRRGDLLTLRHDSDNSDLQLKDAGHIVNHIEIDLSKGANVTHAHYYSPFTKITTDYDIDWEKVNEVWVPKTFTSQTVTWKDHKKVYENLRKVTWTENVVNQPIPEDAFTETAVGLSPGDRVTNTFTKESYMIP